MGLALGLGLTQTRNGVGGAAPAPTPLWSADFVNGVYTVSGAPAVVGDILAENPGWGSWSAANIIPASGLQVSNTSVPVLTGTPLTAALAGSTYVITFTPAATANVFQFDLHDAGFATENGVWLAANGANNLIFTITGHEVDVSILPVPGVDTTSKVAFTITKTHVAASCNGGDVSAHDVAAVVDPTELGMIFQNGAPGYVLDLTAYAVQDDSALVGLSS